MSHIISLVPDILIIPKGNSVSSEKLLSISPFLPAVPGNLQSLWICLFWTLHIRGIRQYVIFCIWLLSLSILFARSTHLVVRVSVLFHLMAEYVVMWIYHIWFIYSPTRGQLNCFLSLPVVTGAAVNSHV